MTVGGDSPLESNADKPEGGWMGVSRGDRTHKLRFASLNEGIRSIIESVRMEIKDPLSSHPLDCPFSV